METGLEPPGFSHGEIQAARYHPTIPTQGAPA